MEEKSFELDKVVGASRMDNEEFRKIIGQTKNGKGLLLLLPGLTKAEYLLLETEGMITSTTTSGIKINWRRIQPYYTSRETIRVVGKDSEDTMCLNEALAAMYNLEPDDEKWRKTSVSVIRIDGFDFIRTRPW